MKLSPEGRGAAAAAAIYLASVLCNQCKTQKEIAEVVGVTVVTIRNRYKEPTRPTTMGQDEEESQKE